MALQDADGAWEKLKEFFGGDSGKASGSSQALTRHEEAPVGEKVPDVERVKELKGKRTAHSTFYRLADGRVQAELSSEPVRYRDSEGDWHSIDTEIRSVDAPGFAFGNKDNAYKSFFGDRPDRLVRFKLDQHQITLGVPAAQGRLAPEVEGDTVTYADVFGDADLVYRVTPSGLKEQIVLERPPEDGTFRFSVKLGGVEARKHKDGSIGFYRKGRTGTPLFSMPKPFMLGSGERKDSPVGRAYSNAVSQSVAQQGSRITVTVRANEKWLNNPDREYPVVIDPTIEIEPTPTQAEDSMISSGQPNATYGSYSRMSVGTTSSSKVRGLVRFDLSSIPDGVKIDRAALRLYYDQTFTTGSEDVRIQAFEVTVPWDEDTVTWNSISSERGQIGWNRRHVDNSWQAQTSENGEWPGASSSSAVNGSYQYNKNAVDGETFTWVPPLREDGRYRVDAHYVAGADRGPGLKYTVHHQGGSTTYTVDQTAGSGGVWERLGTQPFQAGTSHKVVLGDPGPNDNAAIADAVRLTKFGADSKVAGEVSTWHEFTVRNLVQDWVDGTSPNHGLMLKQRNESDLGRGGPRYQPSEYAYNGGSTHRHDNRPKLVVTYGRPSVDLARPTTIHATGAELDWSAYDDADNSGSADDIVEYQVHRSIYQDFTPSPQTLVAPVQPATTNFTDTTAEPTPADAQDPFGRAYYYMVAVKTEDGELIPSTSELVRLPKAGRTVQVFQGDASDTTLSGGQPDQNLDVVAGEPWLEVGNNSSTYGNARAVVDFGDLSELPSNATVQNAEMSLWATVATGDTNAAYTLHPLTRDFAEKQATWREASSGTAWTDPGGDFTGAVASVSGIYNDPRWHNWTARGVVQGWVDDPASNHGFLVKRKNEAGGPAQRTVFLSSEADEPGLRPILRVVYTQPTSEDTYYAPKTKKRMTADRDHTVDVTVTNTTATTWTAADHALSYHWTLPDGTDKTTAANRAETPLPQDVSPGETVTVPAKVHTPQTAAAGNKREAFQLEWDMRDTSQGKWLSGSENVPPLKQNVAVERTSNLLGLESFYQYAGEPTGAGSTLLVNQHVGNSVFSYDAFTNPSRGLATFVRMTYNSLDTSDSALGYGWSLSTSTLHRAGSPLDFHPPGQDWPSQVTLTDGDGTSHLFLLNKHGSSNEADWTYDHPKGVHLYLQKTQSGDASRAWVMTKPDRTQFFFDTEGYLTAISDNNGNELTFTYAERKSNNAPTKFLQYITDAAGRRTLTLDYYEKNEAATYFDAGQKVQTDSLNNPKIIDKVETITGIAGRTVSFLYSDKGLLKEMTDGAGASEPKTFGFTYDATNANKNTKLVAITDPRGNTTNVTYYEAPEDPKDKWLVKQIDDRRGKTTSIAYADPDGSQGDHIETTVTDPQGRDTVYRMDGYGRPIRTTNAKGQVTKLAWNADHSVTRLEENNGAVTTWTYDTKTGYPLTITNAEANANQTPATKLSYATDLGGHVADLVKKVSPEGRTWTFGYDDVGNLTTVTDPKGTATTASGDYTRSYSYDSVGQLTQATDRRGNATTYRDYHPAGYPREITDALDNTTTYAYDERGNVTSVTDAKGHTSEYTYDHYSRPLTSTVPKNASAGEYITTPAPDYDANGNVVETTAPNGAVTDYRYNPADRINTVIEPADTTGDPRPVTHYWYNPAGYVTTVVEPKGTQTSNNPDDYVTDYRYNSIYELTSVTNAAGDTITYSYDGVGNLATVVDPRKNQTSDTGDYTTKYAYNLNHQVTKVTDAKGNSATYDYDLDGLKTAVTDKAGHTTHIQHGQRGLVTEVKVPHKGDGSGGTVHRTTRYRYDQAGNRTKVITPRGVRTPGDASDFVHEFVYDELGRVVEHVFPYDPDHARYNAPHTTTYGYDEVGNRVSVSAPPSAGQSVRNTTEFTYFDNGWVKSVTDQWDITSSYDYNPLGQQTTRTLTSAGGSASRTMSWGYHPDGSLASRSDDGVPAGAHEVLVDNSDTQNTEATGTWNTSEAGSGYQGFNYRTHAGGGTGDETFTWTLYIPADGDYEVFVRYPDTSGAATNAEYTLGHDGGQATKRVDQTANAGEWVSLGTWAFSEGMPRTLTLSDDADGSVAADAVRLVRDNSGATDSEAKDLAYAYDINGNLVEITDNSSGAQVDRYDVSYTGLNQVKAVDEIAGGAVQSTTSYTYGPNGNPTQRTHAGKIANFDYTTRDLPAAVTHKDSASDPDPKVTSYTYTARGLKQRLVKGNDNTVDYSYFRDGLLKHKIEKTASGQLVAEHTLGYNANGMRTSDAVAKMNADDHTDLLEFTRAYEYTPRDRVAKVTKTAPGGSVLETESYVYDANANITSQTVGGTTTSYDYDRNRLLSAQVGGITAAYNYDPFGRLNTVTAAGQIVEGYDYDGFGRVTEHRQITDTGATETTRYAYDPLDRTASETTAAGTTDAQTTEFDYLGLSGKVLSEEIAGDIQRSYTYSPWGRRLSQIKHTGTDTGSPESSWYGYTPHTDVGTLTGQDGTTRATYGYTAYGKPDTQTFTGVDKPDPQNPGQEPYNLYRYNAKRFNPTPDTSDSAGEGGYDMGFRRYDPGLNRFLERDMYAGALANLNLVSSPWTGNRYAFAAGNPVSFVELDGHRLFKNADGTGWVAPEPTTSTDSGGNDSDKPTTRKLDNGTTVTETDDGQVAINGYTPPPGGPDAAALAAAIDSWLPWYREQYGSGPLDPADTAALIGMYCDSPDTTLCGDQYGFKVHAERVAMDLPEALVAAEGGATGPAGGALAAGMALRGLGGKLGRISIREAGAQLAGRLGRNRVTIPQGDSRYTIDLAGKAHFDKVLGQRVYTPHVQMQYKHVGPGGAVSWRKGPVRPADWSDIRIARRYLERRNR